MKKKYYLILLFIIFIISVGFIFYKNSIKNLKIGNNKNSQEIVDYILNLSSYEAEVTVNFRILPGDSVSGVIEHVKKLCEGYDIDLKVISQRAPSNISPENVRGFEIIKEKVNKIYPEAIVTSYITIGGTDSYNIRQ